MSLPAPGSVPAQGHVDYALGYTSSEHERLIRQAVLFAPYTVRLFRDAGIGSGQRVLDAGSGIGDVSMLLAAIVGPSGEVVGVERDAASIAIADRRVSAAGYRNVEFIQADVATLETDRRFDAVAGRFILMFLPDPAGVLRSLRRTLRQGGVVVFQEASWSPFLAFNRKFPLYWTLLSSIEQALSRSGANTEMGPDLFHVFQAAGLPAPFMHMETPLGCDPEFISVISGLISSIRPLALQHGISLDALGNLETLPERIHAEISAANTVASLVSLVGAFARA
jgi:SAM-dependent methyltransferase